MRRTGYNLSLPEHRVSVVIPTVRGGSVLSDCVRSLEHQTWRDFEIILVDNSGRGLLRSFPSTAVVVENERNLGFGAAINQGWHRSTSEYVATLNDDAVADPGWLAGLVEAMDAQRDAGMCASRVLVAGKGTLDSAGMLICADGSSKQRGRGEPADSYSTAGEVLLASGSAAIYRRKMLDEVGGFDESFFLYCEDTDLGLRARWAGWKCYYVPGAVVEHRYSQSAGRASPLKAYYVERNRLFVTLKNFPAAWLWRVPFVALARYFWHLVLMARGRGSAADYRQDGNAAGGLAWIVLRAHAAALGSLGDLWRSRRVVRSQARISSREFGAMLRRYSISPKEVAAQ